MPSGNVQCPACFRPFDTDKGLNTHLSNASSCRWYCKGKLRALDVDVNLDIDPAHPPSHHSVRETSNIGQENLTEDHEEDEEDDPDWIFNWHEENWPEHDDDDIRRVVMPFPEAGKVIRSAGKDRDGDSAMNEGHLGLDHFGSEMDWEFARWAIKDRPSVAATDRLLSIPGLREKLGLSFTNMRSLHQAVDALPDRAGSWKTKELSFKDQPDEVFTIQYRDPLEAIRSLWKDPSLSPHIVMTIYHAPIFFITIACLVSLYRPSPLISYPFGLPCDFAILL
ncbi:hypothetical protein BKA70DRAFT_1089903 [Coprinopsis sp. MPI-PUGE-AT-0042]|nr:hypothetical protein BKA70DRAFT_1089903 [Coprinopsis sp. MPI-PUGE-AT-0042]